MKFFKSKKNTEEKIKEATFEVLASNGFAGVSMREIAKKAQTAVGQLTYYYGTKENLIVSVIDEMINEFLNELENYMSAAEDKLSAIISFYEELFEKESKVFRILIDFVAQSLWNPAYKEKIKHVIIPNANMPNLQDVPEEVLSSIQIHPVKSIDEVLELALCREQ